jgi:glycine betaine/proline transport system permease protein
VSVAHGQIAGAPVLASVEHRPWWRNRLVLSAAIAGAMLVAYFGWKNQQPWPDWLTWNGLITHLDNFQTWLLNHRNEPHPSFVFRVFNGLATFLDDLVTWLTNLMHWFTWIGTGIAGTAIVLRFGGVRAALWVLCAFVTFGLTGLWDESIQTLALMLAAVVLSLLIGVPLGVLAGRSDRFERAITPILDAMQIVPAFAYLMPVVIFFSVGPGAAVITTMIYAVPPAVRITALGIRGVPPNTIEAARAMGATVPQELAKVQIPLARRMLLLSVNQTILFALSMVVIAGLIGGQGLGDTVTSGLNSYPALALLAGLVIVVLAMGLDRATEAIASRTDPTQRHLTDERIRKLRLLSAGTGVVVVAAIVASRLFGAGALYSRGSGRDWILARLQSGLDYVQNPNTFVFHTTSWIGNHIVQYGLIPLQDFLSGTPWFVTVVGATAIALVVSSRRAAVTTFAMLLLTGVIGEWDNAMATLAQVLVATIIAVAIGVALGVWAAESRIVSKILRPVNDVLQTLPQLVYIIPLIYLMPVSIVPGIVAGVLYAFPVVARLVESGLKGVEQNTVEAAAAYGATRRQILTKVKIPLAQNAIMLGGNQGTVSVLAVVVIGGLVGSGGLGYQVAQGLDRSEFGLGVVASIAILALGIALDRITQGARTTRGGKESRR